MDLNQWSVQEYVDKNTFSSIFFLTWINNIDNYLWISFMKFTIPVIYYFSVTVAFLKFGQWKTKNIEILEVPLAINLKIVGPMWHFHSGLQNISIWRWREIYTPKIRQNLLSVHILGPAPFLGSSNYNLTFSYFC